MYSNVRLQKEFVIDHPVVAYNRLLGGDFLMRIEIFTNDALKEKVQDYSRWQTLNGDYVEIATVGNTYIERCLDMLAQFSQKYPNHPLYDIWERYIQHFEEELFSRKISFVST
ncbi:MAG TPA: hypothetical protein DHW61_13400 [Lachnoclostridium phytofermentans]|uniref:Uncharacterized protein n=1 Tax=Lachnoclostridium phytofermentans TaxID=66219 RepID=A0A3D2X8B3_9FIRM|nr:hypothetical protein [Lachnoclostridium phytofermentans]